MTRVLCMAPPEMLLWGTHYRTNGQTYSAEIEAPDVAAAEAICVQRRIGEVLDTFTGTPAQYAKPRSRLPALIQEERWAEATHEATFLSWIAIESHALPVSDALGDEGLVHMLAHLCEGLYSPTLGMSERERARQLDLKLKVVRKVYFLAREMMDRTPGWPKHIMRYHQDERDRMLGVSPGAMVYAQGVPWENALPKGSKVHAYMIDDKLRALPVSADITATITVDFVDPELLKTLMASE